MEDLDRFQVGVEAPVKTDYRGYEVYCCGPWCQGPVLAQALNLLEGYDLTALGHNTLDYVHLLTEALKLVFADREEHYGDPRFVPVPIGGLLSRQYAQHRRELINPNQAWPEMPPPGQPGRAQGDAAVMLGRHLGPLGSSGPVPADTSYVCTVDSRGNAFSATFSDPISDTPIVPGLGITISSRGSQSWVDSGHPSSVQPGKRPRLTPNPAMVLKDGRPFMAFGTPGGDVQCQAMLQVLLNIVDFGMDPQQAVEAPRFAGFSFPNSFYPHRYYPGRLDVESRFPARVLAGLKARGHRVRRWADWDPAAGAVCAIVVDPESGVLKGGADPRRFSYALGW
jgi:gamma-glutamyltranspeptidase/glutathione hydrolase